MRTWIVTGGSGFIGSNFIRKSLQMFSDLRVINLDKLTYAGNQRSLSEVNNDPRYFFIQGCVGDRCSVDAILRKFTPQAIVHFAAESHVDRSIDDPTEFIQTNILGTFNLIETTRKWWKDLSFDERVHFRFLHISTDEVFGSLGEQGYFTEDTPYAPNSPYSASKASSDHIVRAYHHTYEMPVITTHCSNNYGPFQFPEKLIPLMILNAIAGKRLPVYGDGKNVRDWIYVEDHCLAILSLLARGRCGETYNIGGGHEMTNIEIVRCICDILDKSQPRSDKQSYREQISFVVDRPGHDRRYAIDASKISSEIGWRPVETFNTGLLKTIVWYLNNLDWCEQITSGKYRQERLGIV